MKTHKEFCAGFGKPMPCAGMLYNQMFCGFCAKVWEEANKDMAKFEETATTATKERDTLKNEKTLIEENLKVVTEERDNASAALKELHDKIMAEEQAKVPAPEEVSQVPPANLVTDDTPIIDPDKFPTEPAPAQ